MLSTAPSLVSCSRRRRKFRNDSSAAAWDVSLATLRERVSYERRRGVAGDEVRRASRRRRKWSCVWRRCFPIVEPGISVDACVSCSSVVTAVAWTGLAAEQDLRRWRGRA